MYLSRTFNGTPKEVQDKLNELPKDYDILAANLEGNDRVQTVQLICKLRGKEDHDFTSIIESVKQGFEEILGLSLNELKEQFVPAPSHLEGNLVELDDRLLKMEQKFDELKEKLFPVVKKTSRKTTKKTGTTKTTK